MALAEQGSYIYKPCGTPHTYWNPTNAPARLLEVTCPAGFENYFAVRELKHRYGLKVIGEE